MIARRHDGSYRQELVRSTVYMPVPSLHLARVLHDEAVEEKFPLLDRLRPGEELIALYSVMPRKRFVDSR